VLKYPVDELWVLFTQKQSLFCAVFRICDVLIRIRNRGPVPLDYRSDSGYCSFEKIVCADYDIIFI
jgi:hypothetical protein